MEDDNQWGGEVLSGERGEGVRGGRRCEEVQKDGLNKNVMVALMVEEW